jgi:transcriptional regulator with XRE-family HTH domain
MRSSKNAREPAFCAFGAAVREARARRGLSQEELGFAASLHRNYVGAIERGEINPTLRIIIKLGRGLQLRASELMQLAEKHHGGWSMKSPNATATDRDVPLRSGIDLSQCPSSFAGRRTHDPHPTSQDLRPSARDLALCATHQPVAAPRTVPAGIQPTPRQDAA